MDKEFQDKIDNFLLHESDMEQRCKDEFIRELIDDAAKREQYEFTLNVKKAIYSRESKREKLATFHKNYIADKKREKKLRLFKKIIIGASSIAAFFVFGFFLLKPIYWSGNELNPAKPVYSPQKDTGSETSIELEHEDFTKCPSDSLTSDSISVNSTFQEFNKDELPWDKIR